ncbi:hypothetical protein [Tersicoccus solisilvae]|uniref:hypothetical protein n=1 Tax=Tersicoccus solisilvae TaxID=1882339 RepID=UPI0016646019|nr:hypothetical protein [Tersicoccus solisilvae]
MATADARLWARRHSLPIGGATLLVAAAVAAGCGAVVAVAVASLGVPWLRGTTVLDAVLPADLDRGGALLGIAVAGVLGLSVGRVLGAMLPGRRREVWLPADRRVLRQLGVPVGAVALVRVGIAAVPGRLPVVAAAAGVLGVLAGPAVAVLALALILTAEITALAVLRSSPPAAARRGWAPHPGVLAVAAIAGVALGVAVRPWLRTPEALVATLNQLSSAIGAALAPLFGSALAACALLAVALLVRDRGGRRRHRLVVEHQPAAARTPLRPTRTMLLAQCLDRSANGGADAIRGLFRALMVAGWAGLGLAIGLNGAVASVVDHQVVVSLIVLLVVTVTITIAAIVGARRHLPTMQWLVRSGAAQGDVVRIFHGGYALVVVAVTAPATLAAAVLAASGELAVVAVAAPVLGVAAAQLCGLADPAPVREPDGTVQPGLLGVLGGPLLTMAGCAPALARGVVPATAVLLVTGVVALAAVLYLRRVLTWTPSSPWTGSRPATPSIPS